MCASPRYVCKLACETCANTARSVTNRVTLQSLLRHVAHLDVHRLPPLSCGRLLLYRSIRTGTAEQPGTGRVCRNSRFAALSPAQGALPGCTAQDARPRRGSCRQPRGRGVGGAVAARACGSVLRVAARGCRVRRICGRRPHRSRSRARPRCVPPARGAAAHQPVRHDARRLHRCARARGAAARVIAGWEALPSSRRAPSTPAPAPPPAAPPTTRRAAGTLVDVMGSAAVVTATARCGVALAINTHFLAPGPGQGDVEVEATLAKVCARTHARLPACAGHALRCLMSQRRCQA